MPFLPTFSGARTTRNAARLRLNVTRYGRDGDRRRLSFLASAATARACGWQINHYLVVSIGTGEDLGKLQISPSERGGQGVRVGAISASSGVRFSLALPPEIHGVDVAALIDPLQAPCDLAFDVEGRIVTCHLLPQVIPTPARLVAVN